MGNNGIQFDDDGMNWKAEAEFWKAKYFEHMMHTTQIIANLTRPVGTFIPKDPVPQQNSEAPARQPEPAKK